MRIRGIVVLLATCVVSAAHAAPDVKIGLGVWIWQMEHCEGGNIDAIVAQAQAAHLSHVLIRVTSDGDKWAKFNDKAKVIELATRLGDKGITVLAWGYHYPYNGRKRTVRMTRQVELVESVLGNDVFDGYVFNVETEFANRSVAAAELMSPVRQLRDKKYPNKLLGYSTFCRIDRGRGAQMPVAVFNQYCDLAMPQAYWRTFNWPPRKAAVRMCSTWLEREAEWRENGKSFLVKPLIPTAQAYIKTRSTEYVPPLELAHFLDATDGYFGTNVWSWEYMGREHWDVLETGAAKYLEVQSKRQKVLPQQKATVPEEPTTGGATMPRNGEIGEITSLFAELMSVIARIVVIGWLAYLLAIILVVWLVGWAAVGLTEAGRHPDRPWSLNLWAGAAWIWFASLALARTVASMARVVVTFFCWLYRSAAPHVVSLWAKAIKK